ncbi:hypothetical protein [Nocardia tengchongensis]|uniref:hypothetical protein n=1 Tax=Nocardia tengchongensis TaxID=2055889 RepID=UPI003681AF30
MAAALRGTLGALAGVERVHANSITGLVAVTTESGAEITDLVRAVAEVEGQFGVEDRGWDPTTTYPGDLEPALSAAISLAGDTAALGLAVAGALTPRRAPVRFFQATAALFEPNHGCVPCSRTARPAASDAGWTVEVQGVVNAHAPSSEEALSTRSDWRRIRYNSRLREQQPREIPDQQWRDLFAVLRSNRDRAGVALARAHRIEIARRRCMRGTISVWSRMPCHRVRAAHLSPRTVSLLS